MFALPSHQWVFDAFQVAGLTVAPWAPLTDGLVSQETANPVEHEARIDMEAEMDFMRFRDQGPGIIGFRVSQ